MNRKLLGRTLFLSLSLCLTGCGDDDGGGGGGGLFGGGGNTVTCEMVCDNVLRVCSGEEGLPSRSECISGCGSQTTSAQRDCHRAAPRRAPVKAAAEAAAEAVEAAAPTAAPCVITRSASAVVSSRFRVPSACRGCASMLSEGQRSCVVNASTCDAVAGCDGESGGGTVDAGVTPDAGAMVSCTDSSEFANDGECDDGGPDSINNLCALGTDCTDCGPRF